MATGDRCLAASATVRASEAVAALAFLPSPSFCFLPRLRTAGVPAPTFRLACGACFPAAFAVLVFARSVCSVAVATTKAPLRRRMVPALPEIQRRCVWASCGQVGTAPPPSEAVGFRGERGQGCENHFFIGGCYRVSRSLYMCLSTEIRIFVTSAPLRGKRHIRRQVVFSSQPIQRTRCRSAPTTELRPAQRICHDAQTPLRA